MVCAPRAAANGGMEDGACGACTVGGGGAEQNGILPEQARATAVAMPHSVDSTFAAGRLPLKMAAVGGLSLAATPLQQTDPSHVLLRQNQVLL